MFQHMLIPTDGSVLSRKAVEAGIALAKRCGCDFIFMACNGRTGKPPPSWGASRRRWFSSRTCPSWCSGQREAVYAFASPSPHTEELEGFRGRKRHGTHANSHEQRLKAERREPEDLGYRRDVKDGGQR